MSMESHGKVTADIEFDGLGKTGLWSTRAGGAVSSDSTKHREGDGIERSIGSLSSTGEITLTRNYQVLRDGPIMGALFAAANAGARVTVGEQRYDKDGNRAGKPITWTGTVTGFDPGDYDSSSNDKRMIELTVDPDSTVVA